MEAAMGIIPGLMANLGGALGAFILEIMLEMGGFIETTEGIIAQLASAITMLRVRMGLDKHPYFGALRKQ